MKHYSIPIISIYKLLASSMGILIGTLILYLGSVQNIIIFLFKKETLEDQNDLFYNFLLGHINQSSNSLILILAFTMIIFSILEIIFAIGLLLRKKWGAVGLFIVSSLWLPIEILFISKVFLTPKVINIVLNLIILILLFKMITHSREYFKRD